MLTPTELAEYRAQRQKWDELEEQAETHTCECGGALVVANDNGKAALRCGECGILPEGAKLVKPRSWTQRYRDGEYIPVEIANRIEKKLEANK